MNSEHSGTSSNIRHQSHFEENNRNARSGEVAISLNLDAIQASLFQCLGGHQAPEGSELVK